MPAERCIVPARVDHPPFRPPCPCGWQRPASCLQSSKQVNPIIVDPRTTGCGELQGYGALPARSRDIIAVPGVGHILMEGWVDRPGGARRGQVRRGCMDSPRPHAGEVRWQK